ncbi:MAG TPA: DUF559 domain-containing protein [Jatrophihabitantaceae bacterium]|jgi:hypothetical protein
MDAPPDPDWYLDHVVVPGGPQRRAIGPARARQAGWEAQAREDRGSPSAAVRLAARQGFVIMRSQARELSLSDAEVRRLVRAEAWWSPRNGVLAVHARPHLRRERAALAASAAVAARAHTVVSHRSAAVLHGLPTITVPTRPELTRRTDASTGRRDRLHVHRATLIDAQITRWFGAPVSTVARTVADLARTGVEHGLIAADAALHERLVTTAELATEIAFCAGWPGALAARAVLALASPLAESPLESLTRLCLRDGGLPDPERQVRVVDPDDGWQCRVDMLWPAQRVVVEADGRLKYRDSELWREKLRQERLERLGYRVIRVLWDDVMNHPAQTIARVRRALYTR